MQNIRQVIYISTAVNDLTRGEVSRLADESASNNALNEITGALLCIDNCFIQVIEGNKRSISELLIKLSRDWRHSDIRIISDHLQDSRHFNNWSMGLITVPDEDRPQLAKEIHSLSNFDEAKVAATNDSIILMPHTMAMMKRLYETDLILQNARC